MKWGIVGTVTLVAWPAVLAGQEEPTLFGEGVISTDAVEYGATFEADGRTVWFTRRASFDEAPQIYVSVLEGGSWSEPVRAPFSHAAGDEFPSLSADGSRLYFSSTRPVDGVDQRDRNDLWFVERTGEGWSTEPVHLGGALSTLDVDSHPVEVQEGLYFHSRRADGRGGVDAYFAAGARDEWESPTLLDFNSEATDGEVVPAPGGEGVVFYSDRRGGFGRGDLYFVQQEAGSWGEAENLGDGINTPDWEWAPTFMPDGRLVFARLSADGSDSDLYAVPFRRPIGRSRE